MSRHDRPRILLLLAPWMAGLALLVVLPALLAIGIAFTHYDTLSAPRWCGGDNFRALFADDLFRRAVLNSARFVLLAVPLRMIGALALALALKSPRPGVGLQRMAVFFPAIVPDVAYALLWLWIFNPLYGPLNGALHAMGLPAPAWLAEEHLALPALVIMALFQVGEGFIVLLAGLQGIPAELHETAALEGAGRWDRFRWITLPLLAPWLLLLTLRDIILSAQSTFAPAFIMTDGGPYYATLFLPLLIYQEAFTGLRFGSAAAIMLLLMTGVALLIGLVLLVVRGWGYGDEA